MELLIIALTVVLPLLQFLIFPAKTIGRGGSWKFIGAAMIVGVMMAIYFGVNSATSEIAPGSASAADVPGVTDADISALQKLF